MGLGSINLSLMPFVANTDSTRSNMACRQLAQSLTHTNCDIPYVLSNEWRSVRDYSPLGIYIAKDDGEIVYNNSDIMIIFYNNINSGKGGYEVKRIPPVKKTHSNFCSTLRFSLPTGKTFKVNDILFEYDCFKSGYPSFGYNVQTLYTPFFGFTHEDAIVISESLAKKAKFKMLDRVFLPIYEFTILQKNYSSLFGYFPDIGDTINQDVVCSSLMPQECKSKKDLDPTSIKNRVVNMLQTMNLSDLINMRISGSTSGFSLDHIKSRIDFGKITGIKIHKIKKDVKLIDNDLQLAIEKLYNKYGQFILTTFKELSTLFGDDFSQSIMKKYYVYADRDKIRGNINFQDIVYLLEFEIEKEYESHVGDKFANRFAGKGVVSLTLPDELRPITTETKTPVDFVYNPFGVFSRMNLGQLLEATVAKSVWMSDKQIRENPSEAPNIISNLNETVLKHLGNNNYYDDVNKLINIIKTDKIKLKYFTDNIINSNLFVEAPAFSKIDIRKLTSSVQPKTMERVVLKKELIDFMKDKLNIMKDLTITSDITLNECFVAPTYLQKLYKISDKLLSVRDLGKIKSITGQPMKGRAAGGGSKLGQMEIEALLSNGCERTLKEFLTVKCDWNSEKRKLMADLIKTGKYNLPDCDSEGQSKTKTVVNVLLKFLKE